MNVNQPAGYSVVLSAPTDINPRNPNYMGMDRVPTWPSNIPEEAEALDEYVFGSVKDVNTNLIPSLSKAIKLFSAFSRSPREFEVVFCCENPECLSVELVDRPTQPLGYDVASIGGDDWSIVGDIPNSEWAKLFIDALNENGLFRTRQEAEKYLQLYRDCQEADHDSCFSIVFVVRIQ